MARLLLILGLLAGPVMAKPFYYPAYQIDLIRVEVAGKEVVGIQADTTGLQVFQDSTLKITWAFAPHKLGFNLENLSSGTVKIQWDEAAYVDPEGSSRRVIHSATKLVQKDQPQIPTAVPSHSKIIEKVIPATYVTYDKRNREWKEREFFTPFNSAYKEKDIDIEAARAHIGKKVRVLLPIEANGQTVEYGFFFEVKGVEIRKTE